MNSYSLAQSGIFRLLKEGKGDVAREDWFFEAISSAAETVGRTRKAKVVLDLRRTSEAQSDWLNDMEALIRDKRIPNSDTPDNVKHAAFLCYWLRRRQVVRDVSGADIDSQHLRHYPSEFVAARVSMFLLFYTEYFSHVDNAEDVLKQLDGRFPEEFFKDFVVLLRYKNVSPHGIYLTFKALVTTVVPPSSQKLKIVS